MSQHGVFCLRPGHNAVLSLRVVRLLRSVVSRGWGTDGSADLSLAAFAGVPLIVRVLAVTVIVLAAGAIRVLWVERTTPHEQHRSWVFIELGFAVLVAGSLVGALDPSGTQTLPAEAGVAALAGVVLIGSGLALRLSISMPGRALGVVFEALMCIAALALVTWGALLMDNRDPLDTALALLVPIADAVAVWLALRLVRLSHGEPDGYTYLTGALGCLLVVDAALALGRLGTLEIPVREFEVVRLACVCLGAAAALMPSLRLRGEPRGGAFAPAGARPARRDLGVDVARAGACSRCRARRETRRCSRRFSPDRASCRSSSRCTWCVRCRKVHAPSTKRSMILSPGSLTASCSSIASRSRSRRAGGPARRSRCSSSTSTGSRESTTAWGTRSGISSCRPSRHESRDA